MAPTWLPKRNQNQKKIKAKNNQNFDASWGRFFKDYGGFGRHQVGINIASKIGPNFERRIFEKTLFSWGKAMILKILGVEVGSKN